MRGSLILVVGPSGAGKDSLIREAQTHFAESPALSFARRCITRPDNSGGETHEAVSHAEFERRHRGGGFMMAWEAHGLRYGIPREYAFELAAGRSVVANVSRTTIDEARQRLQPLFVLHVTAAPHILGRRLAGRGREEADERAARLRRAVAADLTGDDVFTLRNEGLLTDAARVFISYLTAIVDGTRAARGETAETDE